MLIRTAFNQTQEMLLEVLNVKLKRKYDMGLITIEILGKEHSIKRLMSEVILGHLIISIAYFHHPFTIS